MSRNPSPWKYSHMSGDGPLPLDGEGEGVFFLFQCRFVKDMFLFAPYVSFSLFFFRKFLFLVFFWRSFFRVFFCAAPLPISRNNREFK